MSEESMNISRRTFLRTAAAAAMLGPASCTARAYATGIVSRLSIPAPETVPGLQGLRIAFVSDIHRSDFVSAERVEEIAHQVAALEPDLLLLGGDLITAQENRPDRFGEVLEIFSRVPARLGRWVIQGNHDAGQGGAKLFRDVKRWGFEALLNRGRRIDAERGAFYLAGLEDHTGGHPNAERALRGHAGEPILLLTHNPDAVVERLDAAPPTWLILAGHLHGGQVRLPLMGPPVVNTNYPHVFDWGWGQWNGRRVYVSRGVGYVGVPFRFRCPPEICLFEVTHPGAGWQEPEIRGVSG